MLGCAAGGVHRGESRGCARADNASVLPGARAPARRARDRCPRTPALAAEPSPPGGARTGGAVAVWRRRPARPESFFSPPTLALARLHPVPAPPPRPAHPFPPPPHARPPAPPPPLPPRARARTRARPRRRGGGPAAARRGGAAHRLAPGAAAGAAPSSLCPWIAAGRARRARAPRAPPCPAASMDPGQGRGAKPRAGRRDGGRRRPIPIPILGVFVGACGRHAGVSLGQRPPRPRPTRRGAARGAGVGRAGGEGGPQSPKGGPGDAAAWAPQRQEAARMARRDCCRLRDAHRRVQRRAALRVECWSGRRAAHARSCTAGAARGAVRAQRGPPSGRGGAPRVAGMTSATATAPSPRGVHVARLAMDLREVLDALACARHLRGHVDGRRGAARTPSSSAPTGRVGRLVFAHARRTARRGWEPEQGCYDDASLEACRGAAGMAFAAATSRRARASRCPRRWRRSRTTLAIPSTSASSWRPHAAHWRPPAARARARAQPVRRAQRHLPGGGRGGRRG